jgi:hypothetical protein
VVHLLLNSAKLIGLPLLLIKIEKHLSPIHVSASHIGHHQLEPILDVYLVCLIHQLKAPHQSMDSFWLSKGQAMFIKQPFGQ